MVLAARGVTAAAAAALAAAVLAVPPAAAEPDNTDPAPTPAPVVAPAANSTGGPAVAPGAATPATPGAAEAVADTGKVESSPPETTVAPDGWTLRISAKDETQRVVAPLTTAISSREYVVGGVFNGAMTGGPGGTPEGVFEVGYQIGCGIGSGNGVSLSGTANIGPSIGFLGLDFPNIQAEGLLPGVAGVLGGAVTVNLAPGEVGSVMVTRKEFKGAAPWVSISNFRVKIDGCVGESFIRSYAVLLKRTDEGDAVLSWYGVTKKV